MIISYDDERRLIRTILKAYGMCAADADTVGKVVAHSDFTGVYSHGLSRLILYIRQLENGSMVAQPEIKTVRDSGAIVKYDCGNGSGIVAVNKAYDDVLKKAREFGIGIGVAEHSGNIGCGAYYGCRAAKDDVICIVCCNTLPSMAPFGGADALIGTNPIIVGVPTDTAYPMILDMSTSGVAMGKIQAALREGRSIPEGWANDIDGNPTTDPAKAHAVLPIAGHKGYGLAVMVDVLSAVLSGAAFGTDTGTVEPLTKEDTGFCVIIIDPAKFMPIDEFKKRADSYVHMIKESRKAPGVKELYLPGEIEYKNFEKYSAEGLAVTDAVAAELCMYAAKVGLINEGSGLEELLGVSQ